MLNRASPVSVASWRGEGVMKVSTDWKEYSKRQNVDSRIYLYIFSKQRVERFPNNTLLDQRG